MQQVQVKESEKYWIENKLKKTKYLHTKNNKMYIYLHAIVHTKIILYLTCSSL